MPEKIVKQVAAFGDELHMAFLFAAVGILIGIGHLLASKEVLTPRIIVGRAISTGGLALGAGAALAWMPELPVVAQVGIAAALASLGTSGLERMFQRMLGGSA